VPVGNAHIERWTRSLAQHESVGVSRSSTNDSAHPYERAEQDVRRFRMSDGAVGAGIDHSGRWLVPQESGDKGHGDRHRRCARLGAGELDAPVADGFDDYHHGPFGEFDHAVDRPLLLELQLGSAFLGEYPNGERSVT